MNKASGGDEIPVELFQILKDDAVKLLHSICQQIWKTQQWPQDWEQSVFILISKKGNAKTKECSINFIYLKVDQLCLILCDPMDCTIHGIFQARILEWVAIPFSRGSSQPRDRTQVSRIAGDSSPAEQPGKPKNVQTTHNCTHLTR